MARRISSRATTRKDEILARLCSPAVNSLIDLLSRRATVWYTSSRLIDSILRASRRIAVDRRFYDLTTLKSLNFTAARKWCAKHNGLLLLDVAFPGDLAIYVKTSRSRTLRGTRHHVSAWSTNFFSRELIRCCDNILKTINLLEQQF